MIASLICVSLSLLAPIQAERDIRPLDARARVIRNVNVIPMDREEILENRVVVIEDGRIAAIGAEDSLEIPGDAEVIDAGGRFLLPGLADMHVHLLDPSDFDLLLASGVTTIFNMGGAPIHLEWRGELDRGERLGPILYTVGPMVESSDDPVFNSQFAIETPEQAVELVRHCASAGYDFVKMHGDPPAEVYDATLNAAKANGIRVVGHPSEHAGLLRALELGQATIEHAEEFVYCHFDHRLDDTGIPKIAKRTAEAGTFVTPTLVTYATITQICTDIEVLMKRPELRFYEAWKQTRWAPETNQHLNNLRRDAAPRLAQSLAFQKRLVRALHNEGVPLLTGTDYGGPSFLLPGFDVHEELLLLVECGLTPFEALRASTVHPSRLLESETGVIENGRWADLVLVDENPLQSLETLKRPAGVMVRGRWLDRKELDARVAALLEENEREQRFLDFLANQGVAAAREKARDESGQPIASLPALAYATAMKILGGDSRTALAIAQLNAELYPGSYLPQDHLGKLYAGAGEIELARKHLERSLELNGANRAATMMLEKLPKR